MAPNSAETQQLLDDARAGKADAVERLLAGHRESLRRTIGHWLDPKLAARLDASDVVQEVLLEAAKRLPDYLKNPAMPFHLWLRHIARDHRIDAYRRHRQAERRSMDREQPLAARAAADHSSIELAAQLLDHQATPAAAAMRRELARSLEAALDQLDEDDRDIIRMRHYEQLSNQEVAAFLGLTEPAASMRYLRALRRLKGVFAAGSNGSSA